LTWVNGPQAIENKLLNVAPVPARSRSASLPAIARIAYPTDIIAKNKKSGP